MQTLIYLHGFRSSSQSQKARALTAALARRNCDWELITPDLSHDPAVAFTQIEAIVARQPDPAQNVTLIGSSLGGFYAHVIGAKNACRTVLLNPSLTPFITLAGHVGPQTNLHTGDTFDFTGAHLDVLRAHAAVDAGNQNNVLLIVEMGDALLDHQLTISALPGATTIAVPGGDHNLDSFPQHIDTVLDFAGLVDAGI